MKFDNLWPVIFALGTGLFWGTYGHAVGKARAFEASPFKPYVMIGIAYLVWGIVGGLIGMAVKKDPFSFTLQGSLWGFIGGSLGAFGALSLTLAMYSGGTSMPQLIMPIVFGTAVSVAAIVSVMTTHTKANPILYVGIAGMAICIVIVAYFTPQAPHKPKPSGDMPAVKEAA